MEGLSSVMPVLAGISIADGPLCCETMLDKHVDEVLQIEKQSHFSPWSRASFLSSIQQPSHYCCIVTSPRSAVVAYAVLSTAADEAELLNLTIHARYRRQGIASAFLSYLLDGLEPSLSTCFLEVRVSNRAAIAFYECLGFNELGVRPDYYPALQGRENALIMAKSL